jgi:1,4-dihydroxy-2-naphthoate polyprenyltransferase
VAQFVTLDTSSREYRQHLRGEFSENARALPVPMQETNARASQATFQIVATRDIAQKPLYQKLSELYRAELLGFTLLPVGIICQWAGERSWTNLLLLIAIAAFHGAVFAFNDYFDHMQGVDRMSEKRGSRLIQEGQLRAVDVFKIAWVYWAVAMLAGLPIIIANPKVLYFLGAGLILGTLGSTYSKFGVKALAINDLTLFLCMGPLLTGSVAFAVSGKIEGQHLIIGCGFGLTAMIYVQARHLSTAMSDYRAGVQTLAVRLGFDRVKVLLVLESALVFGVYAFLAGLHWSDDLFAKFFGMMFFSAGCTYIILKNLLEIRSPASSRAESLPNLISRCQFYLTAFLFVILR